MIEALKSFNLSRWIDENPDLSGSKRCIWEDSDFWAFVTWGPNRRTVFHINPHDEIFQQLEGQLDIHYADRDGEYRIASLNPGELFLVPAGVAHSPRRESGSWTLVITAIRGNEAKEHWFWCCDRCHSRLHEVSITGRRMGEPVAALTEATRELKESESLRTCAQCGHCSSI